MKLATYNLWDDERGFAARQIAAEAELRRIGADVLCLQETPAGYAARLAERCGYLFFRQERGLAILSRLPVKSDGLLGAALTVTVEVCGAALTVLDMHLPWDSILRREKQITEAVTLLPRKGFVALCGDFNGGGDDSVQRFLRGQQSLLGAEANPEWHDLACDWAERTGELPRVTLDLGRNPRWAGQGYRPGAGVRMDRLLFRDTYPAPAPVLTALTLFGTEITDGWCPSDHFGVCAALDFEQMRRTE